MKPEAVEGDGDNPLLPGKTVSTPKRVPHARRRPPLREASTRPAPERTSPAVRPPGLLKSAFALIAGLMLVSLLHSFWQGWHGTWVRRQRAVTPEAVWWQSSPEAVDWSPDGVLPGEPPVLPAAEVEAAASPAVDEPAPDLPDAADPEQGPRFSVDKWRRVFADHTHQDGWVNTYWSGVVAVPASDSTQLALHGPVIAAFVVEENPLEAEGVLPAMGDDECAWRCVFEDGFTLSLPACVETVEMALEYGAGWATAPPIEVTASSGKRFHLPMDGAGIREDHGAIRAVATCEWLRAGRAPAEQARRD